MFQIFSNGEDELITCLGLNPIFHVPSVDRVLRFLNCASSKKACVTYSFIGVVMCCIVILPSDFFSLFIYIDVV